MTLRDFNGMTTAGKMEIVHLWGDLLTEKTIPGFLVRVYQVNDFYVEVYYDVNSGHFKRFRTCMRKETVCGW